jgi:glutathione synthase/RimK-type ligase-like ATP-grasp enzyme
MGDGARERRERCAECYQWREDCGQGQRCRACRLEEEVRRLRARIAELEAALID